MSPHSPKRSAGAFGGIKILNRPHAAPGHCLDVQSFINSQPLFRFQWQVVLLYFLIVFLDGLDTATTCPALLVPAVLATAAVYIKGRVSHADAT